MRLILLVCVASACSKPAAVAPDASSDSGGIDAVAEEVQPDPAPGAGIADPPSTTLHDNGCAGVDWQHLGPWLLVAHHALALEPHDEIDRCVTRYAGWVTNDADDAKVSRASLYAALAATGQCAADHDYDGALMSAAQCSRVHPMVSGPDCLAQMASSQAFGISTLAQLLAAPASVTDHDRDPPLMAAFLSTDHVACGGTDRWKLQAPAGFVDHYVAAYNTYQARTATPPVCKKLIVMSVALYTGMDEPGTNGAAQANGCWTYERVSKSNTEWKICQYDGTVFHASGDKWAYDDTNQYNNATTELARINACANGPAKAGYVYMANRGAGWPSRTNTHVRSHFAEIYSSQFTIDDQFTSWKSAGSPGAPMINVGEAATTATQITSATSRTCAEVPDGDWFGLYIYPQTLAGTRLSALVNALNNCTK